MLTTPTAMLMDASQQGRAIGAFNVYNLEGIRAVVQAAEALGAPTMLQIHPAALQYGAASLIAACLAAATTSSQPVAVHLDHSSALADIRRALALGVTSIMADGSHLPYHENVAFIQQVVALAKPHGIPVEGELGRLSGSEDGLHVAAYQERLTNPQQAAAFVQETGIDSLAVCIGNVHGTYQRPPQLDFARLKAIRAAVDIPLVLHGASGLPSAQITSSIQHGICKFNVNTELRQAYLKALHASISQPAPDLIDILHATSAAMQQVAEEKMRLFRGETSQN
jgi:tagatose 1,6-diphosphate aldolase GatY/KbaY